MSELEGPDEYARRAMKRLTRTISTPLFVCHYNPRALTYAEISGCLGRHVNALRHLERRMMMVFRGKQRLFLYKDAVELQRTTGAERYVGAFATGFGLHVQVGMPPHHELAHILCLTWNAPGNRPVVPEGHKVWKYDTPLDKIATEGLADALSPDLSWGRSGREWAGFYVRLGAKLDLARIIRRFPEIDDGLDGYLMAGALVAYLIDRYGIPKVKAWYHRRLAAKEIFGRPIAAMNAEWVNWLRKASPNPVDIARSALDSAWFEKRIVGVRGRVVVTAAADDWWVLFHNGREVGGGWRWWWPRSHRLVFTGNDTLRILGINFGKPRFLKVECVRCSTGAVVARSDGYWSASDLAGKPKPVAIVNAKLGPGFEGYEKVAGRSHAIRGERIWTAVI
jgi:hypothetical protein